MDFLHSLFGMPDVETNDFRVAVEQALLNYGFNAGWIIHGKTVRDKKEPFGFVFARIDGHRMEAHIHFFHYATDRNKLEGEVKFIQEMRQMYTIIAYVKPQDERFFDHICRYGIARRIGIVFEYTDDMKEMLLYQSRST